MCSTMGNGKGFILHNPCRSLVLPLFRSCSRSCPACVESLLLERGRSRIIGSDHVLDMSGKWTMPPSPDCSTSAPSVARCVGIPLLVSVCCSSLQSHTCITCLATLLVNPVHTCLQNRSRAVCFPCSRLMSSRLSWPSTARSMLCVLCTPARHSPESTPRTCLSSASPWAPRARCLACSTR